MDYSGLGVWYRGYQLWPEGKHTYHLFDLLRGNVFGRMLLSGQERCRGDSGKASEMIRIDQSNDILYKLCKHDRKVLLGRYKIQSDFKRRRPTDETVLHLILKEWYDVLHNAKGCAQGNQCFIDNLLLNGRPFTTIT
jgi:hypothetical protein